MLVVKLDVILLDAITQYRKDNGTVALAKELRSHQKSKHIEQQYIRLSQKKYIEVRRVDSMDNVVDPLTNQLSQPKMKVHLEKMRLRFVANWL